MAAPGAIVIAKMLCPQTEAIDGKMAAMEKFNEQSSPLGALAAGTATGVKLMVNIAAMLLVFIGIVALINYISSDVVGRYTGINEWVRDFTDGKSEGLTFQFIVGIVLAPFMWLTGVPVADITLVGSLLGQKTILNEFVAYAQMEQWKDAGLFVYEKSMIMSTYILCGFANISSIGILLGGIGVLAPGKKDMIIRFGFPAMVGGALVSIMSATIIGMIMG
jgi:CNT family concentrative nucleoside transporter